MTYFIIGYMAAGKTTFGRALARRLGYEFIDLDFYIVQRFHRSVSQLFAEKGEAEFRRIESALLREAGEFENVVVACGGGTPCSEGNMEYMLSRGVTVCLEASVECTVRRILQARGKRPIVNSVAEEDLPAFVEEHQKERAPHYGKAHITICGEDLESARDIDRTVDKFLAMSNLKELSSKLSLRQSL